MTVTSDSGKGIAKWLIKAIEPGYDGLEIQQKTGYEEITAMKGNYGFGIGKIKSSSPEAAALRDEL
jgi:hypothetical protein